MLAMSERTCAALDAGALNEVCNLMRVHCLKSMLADCDQNLDSYRPDRGKRKAYSIMGS